MKSFLLLLLFMNLINCLQIYIGSTGLLFPYSLGSIAYLKHNLNYSNINMTGVSGGAWCSIIFQIENNLTNHDYLWKKYIGTEHEKINIFNRKCMEKLQNKLTNSIMQTNIDVKNIPIAFYVTKIQPFYSKNILINKFESLDKIVNFAKCSSYIPFLCGKNISFKYHNNHYIDGVFFHKIPSDISLQISPHYFTLFQKLYINSKLDMKISKSLFDKGWKDSEKRFAKLKK